VASTSPALGARAGRREPGGSMIGGAPRGWLGEAVAGASFLVHLPGRLRRPMTPAAARAILCRRIERRASDFLDLARRAIYERPTSPYRRLLRLAGCEHGDLVRLVTRDGLEGALRTLYRQGVYLTVEEFKGRRPAVRGEESIAIDPGQCRNPLLKGYLWVQSSGSRGAPAVAIKTLDFLVDQSVNRCLVLNGWGGPWRLAHWDVPGGGLTALLSSSLSGAAPERWFSLVAPLDPALNPRYRWSARAVRWASALAGRPLPPPRHVPVDAPLPIARWMRGVLEAGQRPLLVGYSSSIVRLCEAARAAGLDLTGSQFWLDGEPLTRARLEVIRQVGADGVPIYATSETGRMADGCLAAREVDEVHFFSDLHALIQPGPGDAVGSGLPPDALLVSSLRSSTPFILLNVSMGDRATMSVRACGCPLEEAGWTTHLHTIRSYEKLTAGGMTLLDADLVRVLEEVLPARFGGTPTDYQLVEREAAGGAPEVVLVVHPRVGPLSAEAVARTFLAAVGAGTGAERVMGLVWRDTGLLRVERRPPAVTATGKVLHLHAAPSDPAGPAGGAR
jgi:hypothetical protein